MHVLMAFLLGFISIISSLLLLFMKALTLRLVRVDLPNGVEVLITNMMGCEAYEVDLFSRVTSIIND
jgi:hypothetical protein